MHFILGVFFLYKIYIYIYILKKKEKGRKREAHCVLALFSIFSFENRLVNLFSHDMSIVLCLGLISLFIALD